MTVAPTLLAPARASGPVRGRPALVVVFAVLGALSATWASRIPAVAAHLHLSTGALGAVLLGPALGLLASTAASAAALRRVRPQAVMAAGTVVYATSLALVPLAGGAVAAFALLAAWGAGGGAVDVAMNTEAAAVQAHAGRPVMSGLHAAYSVGGLLGAGTGALAAAAGIGVGPHLAVASAVAGVAGMAAAAAAPRLPVPAPPRPGRNDRSAPRRRWLLVGLGAVAFASFLAEGAANDWSALWLQRDRGAAPGLAAVGYAAFAVSMAAGRLAGDHLTVRLGPVRLLRWAAALAACGFGASLAAGDAATGIAGFAALGAGLSVVVPLVFSAAAGPGASSSSVALVNGSGYLGLMVGPPIIGGLADATGLGAALLVVVAAAGLAALGAGVVRPAPAAPPDTPTPQVRS